MGVFGDLKIIINSVGQGGKNVCNSNNVTVRVAQLAACSALVPKVLGSNPAFSTKKHKKRAIVLCQFGGLNETGPSFLCNSNGNIENGDYITSLDYLGYGEKQDDDLLQNYTVSKATTDRNFELEIP